MARKKVTLERIANDATRRATFKKRRKGLMKKASELATLCDVEACVVVYGEGETAQPEVWPDRDTAEKVLTRFRAMPELDQCKKMMDMGGLLTQRVEKLKEQVHKARRENHEREVTMLLHDAMAGRRPGLVGLSVEEIAALGYMVENRLACVKENIERRFGQLGQSQGQGQGQATAAAAAGKQPLQQQGRQQDNNVLPTTMQMQLPLPQVSLPPLVPSYSMMGPAVAGNTTDQQVVHHQAPPLPHLQQQQQQYQQQQAQASWLMEVARAGGDLGALVYSGFAGGRGSFGGGGASSSSTAGASTSGGGGVAGDSGGMLPPQLGNLGPGFAWHDHAGHGFPPFPPM